MSEKIDSKDKYLSKQSTNALKGIFAVAVLAHHLFQHSGLFGNKILTFVFQSLGFVSVAVFFFISGYGLGYSYKKNPSGYISDFPKKRLLPFYLKYLLFAAIYFICWMIIGQKMSTAKIIKTFLFGGTIISKGWYMQVILLFYILFYFIFRFTKGGKTAILWLLMATVLYSVCAVQFLKTSWYTTVYCLVLGVFWNEYKAYIDEFFGKLLFLKSAMVFVLFIVLYFAASKVSIGFLQIIFRQMSMLFFAVFVMLAVRFLCAVKLGMLYNNAVTCGLGKISLEIYVLQGLFFELFHSKVLYVESVALYSLLVVISTIVASVIFHNVLNAVTGLPNKKKALN